MADAQRKPPILVLGVPRSGTTLLRTLLDSHPSIACGPETPWLAPHQPRSVGELHAFLTRHPQGACASFGLPTEVVTSATRALVDTLLGEYARRRGKSRWAEKTPDDVLHLDFLAELLPDAAVVWIVREGLDVAVSTSVTPPHRRGISEWHEKNLALAPGVTVENNAFNALLRWGHWNRLIGRSALGCRAWRVRYEDLVRAPEPTVRGILAHLGEPFDPAVLAYATTPHDHPGWEWGSADVRAHGAITSAPVGRARRELAPEELEVLGPLARAAGGGAPDRPAIPAVACRASLASVREIDDARYRLFMRFVNSFAGPLGLRTFTDWSKVWEYPWLWFGALDQVDWSRGEGVRLVDLGSELSPMPWIAALLGARVTLVETDARFVPAWTRLRDRLRVRVEWRITGSERLPMPDASADVLTSFSVIEHQPDKRRALDEAARVLATAGLLALSFDICEPSLGMSFPAWNGSALTLAQFEELVWSHPALAGGPPPAWNLGDVPAFLDWHRRSAPHHTYAVGAAVLTRRGAPVAARAPAVSAHGV